MPYNDVMRAPKPRDCKVMEAYPAGPSEFYSRDVLSAPASPAPEAEAPPSIRPLYFVRSFPRVAPRE